MKRLIKKQWDKIASVGRYRRKLGIDLAEYVSGTNLKILDLQNLHHLDANGEPHQHLQTILLSFEGQKIESRSKQVFSILRGVQKDYSKLDDNLGVLNRHLTNAYNQMSNAQMSLTSLGQKISSTQTLSSGKN